MEYNPAVALLPVQDVELVPPALIGKGSGVQVNEATAPFGAVNVTLETAATALPSFLSQRVIAPPLDAQVDDAPSMLKTTPVLDVKTPVI
jgi:hypothetical protein